jgi:Gas vesicle synthesis protein GvpL/GvpF.
LLEFCGEAAEARLQDLAWLGPRACRHAAVIEEVMRQTPVLPARFATLFTSLDSLQQAVHEHREAITGFFARLGDKQEWAVKGLLDRAGALRRLGSPEPSAPATSPGARYFQEKRIQAQWERDFNFRLKEFCRRAAAALGAEVNDFRERPALGAVADAEVVLNWAFLVAPAALEDFRVRLGRFNGEEAFPGLLLTPSGPWPPYSFAPDLSGGAQA